MVAAPLGVVFLQRALPSAPAVAAAPLGLVFLQRALPSAPAVAAAPHVWLTRLFLETLNTLLNISYNAFDFCNICFAHVLRDLSE